MYQAKCVRLSGAGTWNIVQCTTMMAYVCEGDLRCFVLDARITTVRYVRLGQGINLTIVLLPCYAECVSIKYAAITVCRFFCLFNL
jgi:hypothetical protein